jgi:hypothetical protein
MRYNGMGISWTQATNGDWEGRFRVEGLFWRRYLVRIYPETYNGEHFFTMRFDDGSPPTLREDDGKHFCTAEQAKEHAEEIVARQWRYWRENVRRLAKFLLFRIDKYTLSQWDEPRWTGEKTVLFKTQEELAQLRRRAPAPSSRPKIPETGKKPDLSKVRLMPYVIPEPKPEIPIVTRFIIPPVTDD